MTVRAKAMTFAGGMAVFPGGRVDDADRPLAEALAAPGLDEEALDDLAGRIAAVRETIEETGLVIGIDRAVSQDEARAARELLVEHGALAPVLEGNGWSLALDTLTYFARWRPKHRHLKIFDTRFFLADLGTGAVEIAVDATENTHMFWISASDALARADAGELSVIFPTRRNLERLAQHDEFKAIRRDALAHPIEPVTPWLEERDGTKYLTIPGHLGYPVTQEKLDGQWRG